MIENRVIYYNGDLQRSSCDFYTKMGACRHGTSCTKVHEKPLSSSTIVLKNLYLNPKYVYDQTTDTYFYSKHLTEREIQQHFDNVFEDIFVECEDKYGEILDMVICDNFVAHLRGNVYIKFTCEEDAEKAEKNLNNRWFGGRPVYAELSPVVQFNKAYCRAQSSEECPKDDLCNFWHAKQVSAFLFRRLKSGRKYNPWFLRIPKPRKPSQTFEESVIFKNNNDSISSSSVPPLKLKNRRRRRRSRSRRRSRDSSRTRSRSSRDTSRTRSPSSRYSRNRSRSTSRSDRSSTTTSSSRSYRRRSKSKSNSSRRRTRSRSRSRRHYKRSSSSSRSKSR